ncbi:MAG: ribose-5-phosphate isomerase RpiA [Candidatus Bathyarchaeota archaeon]|nr:ribose-5-phosphate isomerase RpiA [Candidatus Bathyarchaeota archaeon]
MSWKQEAKRKAADRAIHHVKSGMVVGLGSGSTAAEGIRALGERLRNGELTDVKGVPTSYQAIQEAIKVKVPLTTLDEYPELDMGFDGVDQMDHDLNAIKGGGGALLREKIVASCCREYILIADNSKLADILGTGQAVYCEVHPIAVTPVMRKLEAIGGTPVVRQATGKLGPVVTDNGNNLIDVDFGPIKDPKALNQRLHSVQGLLETGLFIGYADLAYVGTETDVLKLTK